MLDARFASVPLLPVVVIVVLFLVVVVVSRRRVVLGRLPHQHGARRGFLLELWPLVCGEVKTNFKLFLQKNKKPLLVQLERLGR